MSSRVLLAVGIFVLGGKSLLLAGEVVKKPVKEPPGVLVVTPYAGLSALDIEQQITNVVEDWVSQAPGLRRVESRSLAGVSIVKLYFREEAGPGRALTVTGALARAARSRLPAGCQDPLVLPFRPEQTLPAGILVLDSPEFSIAQLSDLARQVRGRLQGLADVGPLAVQGGTERAWIVFLDPLKLQARRLSLLEVKKALGKALRVPALGSRPIGEIRYQLTLGGNGKNLIQELNKFPIGRKANLLLGDVGVVKEGGLPWKALVRINGRRGVSLPLYATGKKDARKIRQEAAKALPALVGRLPRGLRLQFLDLGDGASGEDDGLLMIHLRAPSGTRLEVTEKHVSKVENLVKQVLGEDLSHIYAELGLPQGWPAAFSWNAGDQDATLYVQLTAERKTAAAAWAAKVRRRFQTEPDLAGLEASFVTRQNRPIKICIAGGTMEQSRRLAQEVQKALARLEGAVDVRVLERLDAPSLNLQVDRTRLALLGLSSEDIVTAVASTSPEGWPVIPGKVYLSLPGKGTMDDLRNLPVAGPATTDPIPLAQFARLERTQTPVEVHHVGQRRVFHVLAGMEKVARERFIQDATRALRDLAVPTGMEIKIEGTLVMNRR